MDLAELKKKLNLNPHPEGGFYNESFRSQVNVSTEGRTANKGIRCAGTVIYFLLSPESPNAKFCKNQSEIMHVWCGGGAQVHTFILPDGSVSEHLLGPRVDQGQSPQVLCPAGAWKSSRLLEEDKYSLITEVVFPGWELFDFEMGRTDKLVKMFPQHRELIEKFTFTEDISF